jgi:hypothetical protein
MVNLWIGIPAEYLCDKHLNAAINEGLNLLIRHHMAKGHKITGWIRNGCITLAIIPRIQDLITESKRRNKNWSYQLTDTDREIIDRYWKSETGKRVINTPDLTIDSNKAILKNPVKLAERCPKCKTNLFLPEQTPRHIIEITQSP